MPKLARVVPLILILLAAPPTAAAVTTKATLGPAKPTFSWSGHGAGLPGFECSNEAIFRCDTVVFTLEVAGDLNLAIDVEGSQITNPAGVGSYPNFDLYLFASDAEGAKKGEPVAEAVTPVDDEQLTAKGLAAGHYVLEIRSSESIGEDFQGKAKLLNFAAPPAPPTLAQPSATPPASKKPTSARSHCAAKAKKLKSKRKRAAAMKRCKKRKN